MELLYRYERFYIGDPLVDNVHAILISFRVKRLTPCGFWIEYYGKEKWVTNNSKSRFAYPSKESAMTHFEMRTKRCVKILKNQLRLAEYYYAAIKNNSIIIQESTTLK